MWHEIFLSVYPVWFFSAFWSIGLCPLPNLGIFNHYFLKYFFIPTLSPLWNSSDMNGRSFVTVLEVSCAFMFTPFFWSVFPFFSYWLISVDFFPAHWFFFFFLSYAVYCWACPVNFHFGFCIFQLFNFHLVLLYIFDFFA